MPAAAAATGTDLGPLAGAVEEIVRARLFAAEFFEPSAGGGLVPSRLQISQATECGIKTALVETPVSPEPLHGLIGDRRRETGVRVDRPVPVQQRVKLRSLLAAISQDGPFGMAGQLHPGGVPGDFARRGRSLGSRPG